MTVMERERWTDERLDKSFDRIDADLRELRVEMRRGFEKIGNRLEAMQAESKLMQAETTKRFESTQSETTKRFEAVQREINKRFDVQQSEANRRSDALQRNMTSWFIALFSALVTCLLAGLGALVTLT